MNPYLAVWRAQAHAREREARYREDCELRNQLVSAVKYIAGFQGTPHTTITVRADS